MEERTLGVEDSIEDIIEEMDRAPVQKKGLAVGNSDGSHQKKKIDYIL